MFNLIDGKKSLVTGGAQGIGYAVALIYGQNGADVVIADINYDLAVRSAEEIGKQTGKKILPCKVDISDRQSVNEMVDFAVGELGRIDICCHSAGILIHSPLMEMSEEQWDRIFDVNVKGTFFVNQAVARVMKDNGGGKIVDFSSCSGKKPTLQEGGYCSTKSAVNGFIKVAALEWGQYSINVNAVCPGATDTPMVRETFLTSEEIEREWIEKTALKRLGQPIDQARAVLFLSSILADHITGETLVVSAGEMMTQ